MIESLSVADFHGVVGRMVYCVAGCEIVFDVCPGYVVAEFGFVFFGLVRSCVEIVSAIVGGHIFDWSPLC